MSKISTHDNEERGRYMSIERESFVSNEEINENSMVEKRAFRHLQLIIFTIVYISFLAVHFWSNEIDAMKASLVVNNTTDIEWTNSSCTTLFYGEVFAIGAVIVIVAIPLLVWGIGLSLLGPVAGGWFAANMGASISALSFMAFLQSLAMGGNAFAAYIIAVIGGMLGGLSAIEIISLLKFCG